MENRETKLPTPGKDIEVRREEVPPDFGWSSNSPYHNVPKYILRGSNQLVCYTCEKKLENLAICFYSKPGFLICFDCSWRKEDLSDWEKIFCIN